ncbi:MAG: aspartate-semialdehyde dehydrogenase [Armatimonadota bacterium]|nr:aspartate-semialdehyde dehydrogenase [Armatimonadota bacterium]MDR7421736.1 aspartate-semialdehyde dehydrogenase [Armatimonadota bacterium]MDR7453711.1 aspartate-semialdehyde dehydrogenase [Armatimonadota bacterium]MDR7456414.1 aspartate-semialdehyde dehydrogenase [Armatimonadota bacterium]MDR7497810.1 aspartate-semialdehyde dehydrogenase [Armatimonadota bacterium]
MMTSGRGRAGTSAALDVAVVGATGVVGGAMVRILEERAFPVGRLRLYATARSAGKAVPFRGATVTVEETGEGLTDADLVLFAGGDDASRRFAWAVAEAGGVAVDNSSTWRMDPRVPLVVPEVNAGALAGHRGVVANPNCTTMALVMALKPIHDAARIRRVVVASYQSVSGGGLDNMRALLDQTRALLEVPDALERGDAERVRAAAGTAHPVAFNVRPQWKWQPDGDTEEEAKVVAETRKIMDADIAVSVTTMRVPVLVGHTLAVHLDLGRPLEVAAARAALAAFPGVEVVDEPAADRFPTPLQAAGRDPVLVGRVRPDPFDPSALRLVVASDNLRKGAALNAVQIAEHLLAAGRLGPRRPAARR